MQRVEALLALTLELGKSLAVGIDLASKRGENALFALGAELLEVVDLPAVSRHTVIEETATRVEHPRKPLDFLLDEACVFGLERLEALLSLPTRGVLAHLL